MPNPVVVVSGGGGMVLFAVTLQCCLWWRDAVYLGWIRYELEQARIVLPDAGCRTANRALPLLIN